MVRQIINWCDNKTEKLMHEEPTNKNLAKAFGVGAVEGMVDGVFFTGVMAFVVYGCTLLANTKK